MLIAFLHDDSSFLPEIKAYQQFFNKRNIDTVSASFDEADTFHADVNWYIMGFSMHRKKDVVTIHEYTSASTPPCAGLKNAAKRIANARPDFRLFLNEYVKNQLGFDKQVPYGYRDMGIDPSIFQPEANKNILYDFIYVGNLHYTRKIDPLLESFISGSMRQHSLLIVSRDYEDLARKVSSSTNIHFAGPVDSHGVAAFIHQSGFAINYIPDIAPYNRQTSTKLLEYAACGIPIISSFYPWINQFKKQNGGDYFFLKKDFSNFNWESVKGFNYTFPNLNGCDWESRIAGSGILAFLNSKFPDVKTLREL